MQTLSKGVVGSVPLSLTLVESDAIIDSVTVRWETIVGNDAEHVGVSVFHRPDDTSASVTLT